MDFKLNLSGNMQQQANADAAALEKLNQAIVSEQKALGAMEKQMRAIQKAGTVDIQVFRALSGAIQQQKDKVAALTQQQVAAGQAGLKHSEAMKAQTGSSGALASFLGNTLAQALIATQPNFTFLTSLSCFNTTPQSTGTDINLTNGVAGATIYTVSLRNTPSSFSITFPMPLGGSAVVSANTAIHAKLTASQAAVTCNATGIQSRKHNDNHQHPTSGNQYSFGNDLCTDSICWSKAFCKVNSNWSRDTCPK